MPTRRDYRATKRTLLTHPSAEPMSTSNRKSVSTKDSGSIVRSSVVSGADSFKLAPIEGVSPLTKRTSLVRRLSPFRLVAGLLSSLSHPRSSLRRVTPRQVSKSTSSRFRGGVLSWQTSGGVRRLRVSSLSQRFAFSGLCASVIVLLSFSGFLFYQHLQLSAEHRRLSDSAALLRQAHSVLVDGSDNIFSDDYSGLNPDANAKSLGLRSDSEQQAFSVLALSRKMLSLLEPRSILGKGSAEVSREEKTASDIKLLRDRALIERDLRHARKALRTSEHRNGTLSLETADLQKKYARLERDLKAHRKDLKFQQAALSESSRRTEAAEDRLSHIETSAFSLLSDLRDVLGAEEIISSSQDPMLAIRDLAETFAHKSNDRRTKLLAYSEYLDYAISGLERTIFSVGIAPSFLEGLGYDISSSVASLDSSVSGSGSSLSGVSDLVSIGIGGPLSDDDQQSSAPQTSYKETFTELDSRFERFNSLRRLVSCMPLGHPLRGGGRLVSGYGRRLDPFTKEPAVHYGIDFGSWYDTDVYPGGKGRVTYTGYKSSYGRIVEVSHGCGFQTRYAHLSSISVKIGDEIDFDSVLGKVGNSGRSTGPHLHYEVRLRNSPFDPQPFLRGVRNVF